MLLASITALFCFFLLYGLLPLAPLAAGCLALGALFYLHRKRHRHHGGFLSLDHRAQHSALARRSPAVKTALCFCAAFFCVGADCIPLSLLVLGIMSLVTVGAGKIPAGYYLSLLAVPVGFIVLSGIAILWEVSPQPLGVLDVAVLGRYLAIAPGGRLRAISVTARALGAVSCLYALSLSTPIHQIIGVFRRVRVPAVAVELMYLIYRYIFIMLDTQRSMAVAAQSRLGYRSYTAGMRSALRCSLNLLVISFRRASDCFAAMESRCYDGAIRFQESAQPARRADKIALAAGVTAMAGLWLLARRGLL